MDGIIIINKPKGCTSHDVVYRIKKIYGEKIGHTGTLDPNATGVLPILIGNGTKLSKYLINHDKTYIATIQLGIKTDTADSEGTQIETKPVLEKMLESKEIEKVLQSFKGNQVQTPPIYSAIKVKGKKLYEYARSGQQVEIPKRNVTIYSINLLNIDKKNKQIVIEVKCSKGTYIRSLCEDIAFKLETVGYMKELNRTQVGVFYIEKSITLDDLNIDRERINEHLITMEELLFDNESIILEKSEILKFLNGVKIKYDLQDGLYKIYNSGGVFIGTGTVNDKDLKRDIIINN
ncbi:MAG TPA: tRNA pseudouridine(55) synthase TruB [Clostridia bacterium]|nr:tRNA pseudouridine(55) synthase TruB [Clostridia bacterium]